MDPHVEILEAAGITQQPYPLEVVPKILNYSLLRNRVFDLLVEQHAAEVLATRFHEAELKALRVHCRIESTKPTFRIQWALVPANDGLSGGQYIVAESFVGDNRTHDEIFRWQPRTIEEARQIRFRGEGVPGDILWLYSQYLAAPNAEWAAEMRQQEKFKAEQAQKKQGVLTGDLAVAVAAGSKH